MNIDYLIEQLQYAKKDTGDSKIVEISGRNGMMLIRFNNGIITEIWWD